MPRIQPRILAHLGVTAYLAIATLPAITCLSSSEGAMVAFSAPLKANLASQLRTDRRPLRVGVNASPGAMSNTRRMGGPILALSMKSDGGVANGYPERRSVLSGAAAAAPLFMAAAAGVVGFAPTSANAAKKARGDGKWAQHFGEFADEEISGEGWQTTPSGLKYKEVVAVLEPPSTAIPWTSS